MAQETLDWLDERISDKSRRAGAAAGRPTSRRAADAVAFLSGGFPDRRVLPKDTVIEATRTALEKDGQWALQYGPTTGDPGLIEALLGKLERDQGITAGPENVLISAGASQAVALATTMLIEPGDVVISEAPTWAGAVRRFTLAQADVREIDIDADGANVDQIEQVLKDLKREGKRAKLIYVIPNFQNPLGVTTGLDRRKRIVELAAEHGVPIMEDDAYFDLRYDGDFLPTLYTLDESGNVMYMGTFSKNMAAGIRLGWTIADPEIIRRMAALKFEGGTNMFASHIAAEWTRNGTLANHVQTLRQHYKRSRDAMLEALTEHMPVGAQWTEPEGGFFIWLTLPDGRDALDVAARAGKEGVIVSPGPNFYFSDRGQNELRLSYAFPTEDEIRKGIKILGKIVAGKK